MALDCDHLCVCPSENRSWDFGKQGPSCQLTLHLWGLSNMSAFHMCMHCVNFCTSRWVKLWLCLLGAYSQVIKTDIKKKERKEKEWKQLNKKFKSWNILRGIDCGGGYVKLHMWSNWIGYTNIHTHTHTHTHTSISKTGILNKINALYHCQYPDCHTVIL